MTLTNTNFNPETVKQQQAQKPPNIITGTMQGYTIPVSFTPANTTQTVTVTNPGTSQQHVTSVVSGGGHGGGPAPAPTPASSSSLVSSAGHASPAVQATPAASASNVFSVSKAKAAGFTVIPTSTAAGGYLLSQGGYVYDIYGDKLYRSGSVITASSPLGQSLLQQANAPSGKPQQVALADYATFGKNAKITSANGQFTLSESVNGVPFTYTGNIPAGRSPVAITNSEVDLAWSAFQGGANAALYQSRQNVVTNPAGGKIYVGVNVNESKSGPTGLLLSSGGLSGATSFTKNVPITDSSGKTIGTEPVLYSASLSGGSILYTPTRLSGSGNILTASVPVNTGNGKTTNASLLLTPSFSNGQISFTTALANPSQEYTENVATQYGNVAVTGTLSLSNGSVVFNPSGIATRSLQTSINGSLYTLTPFLTSDKSGITFTAAPTYNNPAYTSKQSIVYSKQAPSGDLKYADWLVTSQSVQITQKVYENGQLVNSYTYEGNMTPLQAQGQANIVLTAKNVPANNVGSAFVKGTINTFTGLTALPGEIYSAVKSSPSTVPSYLTSVGARSLITAHMIAPAFKPQFRSLAYPLAEAGTIGGDIMNATSKIPVLGSFLVGAARTQGQETTVLYSNAPLGQKAKAVGIIAKESGEAFGIGVAIGAITGASTLIGSATIGLVFSLSNSGLAGFVAGGAVSFSVAGAALTEAPYLVQGKTAPLKEVAYSAGGSALVGGVLGGLAYPFIGKQFITSTAASEYGAVSPGSNKPLVRSMIVTGTDEGQQASLVVRNARNLAFTSQAPSSVNPVLSRIPFLNNEVFPTDLEAEYEAEAKAGQTYSASTYTGKSGLFGKPYRYVITVTQPSEGFTLSDVAVGGTEESTATAYRLGVAEVPEFSGRAVTNAAEIGTFTVKPTVSIAQAETGGVMNVERFSGSSIVPVETGPQSVSDVVGKSGTPFSFASGPGQITTTSTSSSASETFQLGNIGAITDANGTNGAAVIPDRFALSGYGGIQPSEVTVTPSASSETGNASSRILSGANLSKTPATTATVTLPDRFSLSGFGNMYEETMSSGQKVTIARGIAQSAAGGPSVQFTHISAELPSQAASASSASSSFTSAFSTSGFGSVSGALSPSSGSVSIALGSSRLLALSSGPALEDTSLSGLSLSVSGAAFSSGAGPSLSITERGGMVSILQQPEQATEQGTQYYMTEGTLSSPSRSSSSLLTSAASAGEQTLLVTRNIFEANLVEASRLNIATGLALGIASLTAPSVRNAQLNNTRSSSEIRPVLVSSMAQAVSQPSILGLGVVSAQTQRQKQVQKSIQVQETLVKDLPATPAGGLVFAGGFGGTVLGLPNSGFFAKTAPKAARISTKRPVNYEPSVGALFIGKTITEAEYRKNPARFNTSQIRPSIRSARNTRLGYEVLL